MPPAEVALLAQGIHQALVEAASEPKVRGLEEGEAPRFWRSVGRHYADAAQPTRAIAALERALGLDPSLDGVHELLGNLYLDRRDYAGAERALLALLRRGPETVDAWLRLAAALARQSKWVEARGALRKAREIDPDAPLDQALLDFVEQKAAERE
jgi:tetratricopeptide (TPR) repeat protein